MGKKAHAMWECLRRTCAELEVVRQRGLEGVSALQGRAPHILHLLRLTHK
jgi:hypothetical protein